jgi:hypothetical protein
MYVCNTGTPLKLPEDFELPENKKVYIDNVSMLGFTSLGAKYNHAIKMAKNLFPGVMVVTSADDDDIFLPNHISEGIKGMGSALLQGKVAYKPYWSYARSRDQEGLVHYEKVHNALEPSIFVTVNHIITHGFAPVSIRYHQQWLDPLEQRNKILVDKNGVSTLIYNWGDNGGADSWEIYKMSGSGDDSRENLKGHLAHSKDMGNNILVPAEDNTLYYTFKL